MSSNMQKVKAQMEEHWDMSGEDFDNFVVTETFEHKDGWEEIVFDNGTSQFFIEVNNTSEVWHFAFIGGPEFEAEKGEVA